MKGISLNWYSLKGCEACM